MPRRRKYAQYRASGCKICGDKTIGRGIARHVQGAHAVDHDTYRKCFESGQVIVDTLVETGTTAQGKRKVIIHALVRRFTVPA
jgi:hypothetical protein